jgi:signal transduction histidine kinase
MLQRLARLSLRGKLTLAALAPLLLVLLLVAIAAYALINGWIVGEAQRRVTRQLHAAREVLRHEEAHLHDTVRLAAQTPELLTALASGDRARLAVELASLYRREGLDLLTLTDPAGNVVCRGANPGQPGAAPAPPGLRPALASGQPATGPYLLDAAELQREGETLARKARLPLRTPAPDGRRVEERGLFLLGSVPLHGSDGRLLGYLYGATLLNGNLALVDRIQEVIYGGETHAGLDSGSATVFLEDLRVATTVRLADGDRAIGTLISPQVATAVLKQRQNWLDRALVVDQWYLTAYEPLVDSSGNVVGALYVGLLERPYQQLKTRAALILCGLLLLGSGVGFVMVRSAADHLSRPLLVLDASARRVADGERDLPLPVTSSDEIGRLTETFNRMTRALGEREEALQRFTRELEAKVAERTQRLEEQSLSLLRAHEELERAERLAAIGSLAAGVAHEINNPAAIIRGNVELLRRELPATNGQEEVVEVLRQIERISLITQGLLTFARQQRFARQPLALNPLLTEILAQIGHQVPLGAVTVRSELAPDLPELTADREQLRQVFTNLILNALQAMAGTGTLTVSSRRCDGGLEVAVADTGPGLSAELREKIFHPFFTTRPDGSGLGLSIAYGILQTLGGSIAVQSQPGAGATFVVRLPAPSPTATVDG